MRKLCVCCSHIFFALMVLVPPAALLAGGGGDAKALRDGDVVPVDVSDELSLVLVSNPYMRGLRLIDTENGESIGICRQQGSAQYAAISPDGGYVCYKTFEKGRALQTPMLFDIVARRAIALSAPLPLAGTPAVSADGKVAFTAGKELNVLTPTLQRLCSFTLDHHVNLICFSPDGRKIAYNNQAGQIVVLDIATGRRKTVTDGRYAYWGPQFSPKGDKIVVSTVDGKVAVASAKRRAVRMLGVGESPTWTDNETVAYVARQRIDGHEVIETELILASASGAAKKTALAEPGDATIVASAGNVAVAKSGGLRYGYLRDSQARLIDIDATVDAKALAEPEQAGERAVVDYGSYVRIDSVPYLHQLYDTPDYWNGNSSCGASAAIMAIQYYAKLPSHPMTVSYPTTHTSEYGWYVPEIYTFNGHTYNIASRDPNRTRGYGGFGYITQNNWEDTKGHMAEYINYHGPASSVDWSPTFAKAGAEVDGNTPFVLLNSLTSSGHYITCIGYYKAQYTLIFNDPYGNKNVSYPSVDGRNVCYDWPGYNNGFANLNTVYCFIYCREYGALPPLTNVAAGNITDTQATITWTSSVNANSVVEYGQTTSYGATQSDAAMVTEHSVVLSGLTPQATYHYRVKSLDASNNEMVSGDYTFTTLASGQVPDIVIDNAAATVTGTWTTGTGAVDKYGSDYRYKSQGTGAAYVEFIPAIAVAGDYDVYEWHPQGTNRTVGAPHTVTFSGGSQTINVNQQVNGGAWNKVGTFAFAAGTAGSVKITDAFADAGMVVMADAIKLVHVAAPPPAGPAAPGNLTAAVVSSSQVNLAWTDNASNETGFVVEYKRATATTWTVAGTPPADTEAYSVTGLAARTSYNFRVKAVNGDGSSSYSNTATAKTSK